MKTATVTLRDAATRATTVDLAAEWDRLELLGSFLTKQRQGVAIPDAELERLRAAQLRAQRQRSAWMHAVAGVALNPVECDVLLCAAAPEAEPRLGWMFQHLQGTHGTPYPSPAFVQELLAMNAQDASALYAALAPDSTLLRRRLVQIHNNGQTEPYRPLHPGQDLVARLLGRPVTPDTPPGATRVALTTRWDDLVLPPSSLAMLREFLLWIRHRGTVVEQWGGQASGGPVALFTGPSGTGKTCAAAAMANELGWPLFRVDLSQVVNKYIGETEKNLGRVFDAAEGQNAVLLFDEADALFGRRSEVKDAHDRYANLEVGYLLQRIEAHHGPCILATNLRQNFDPAFARRFQLVIDFPRPDAGLRAELWRRLLPPRAPRAAGVDPDTLGRAVVLTGGQIRNAALHAAYLAAGAGHAITLGDVALAVWREVCKEDREVSRSDLGDLAHHVPEELC
jgi:hypothetical protein